MQEIYCSVIGRNFALAVHDQMVNIGYNNNRDVISDNTRWVYGGSARPSGITTTNTERPSGLGDLAQRYTLEQLFDPNVIEVIQMETSRSCYVNENFPDAVVTATTVTVGCQEFDADRVLALADALANRGSQATPNTTHVGRVFEVKSRAHASGIWVRLCNLGYRPADGTPPDVAIITAHADGHSDWVANDKGPNTRASWLGGRLAAKHGLTKSTLDDTYGDQPTAVVNTPVDMDMGNDVHASWDQNGTITMCDERIETRQVVGMAAVIRELRG